MLDHYCTYCDPNDGDTVKDIDVFNESGDDRDEEAGQWRREFVSQMALEQVLGG